MCIATAGQFADLPRFALGAGMPGAFRSAPREAAPDAIVRSAEDALDAEEREALLLSLAVPARDLRQAA